MKHILLFAVVLTMATTAFGATCATFTATPSLPDSVTCGDKTIDFSALGTFSGGKPTVTVSETAPSVFVIDVTNTNGLKANFNFDYVITAAAGKTIQTFAAGILGGTGGTLTTTVTPGGLITGSGPFGGGAFNYSPGVSSLTVTNHYVGNGTSYAVNLDNTIIQGTSSPSPEPLTLALTGIGLAAFGCVARRKFGR